MTLFGLDGEVFLRLYGEKDGYCFVESGDFFTLLFGLTFGGKVFFLLKGLRSGDDIMLDELLLEVRFAFDFSFLRESLFDFFLTLLEDFLIFVYSRLL